MFTVARLNVEAGATIGGALSGLRTLTRAVGAFGGFLGGIAQTALGVLGGQALFAGLSAGFQSTIGNAVELNATLENNAASFTQLLGSAGAADQLLGQLRVFAASTPFTFVGLAETAKQMLGMQFTTEQIIPLLTDAGNIAAGLHVDPQHLLQVLGQMHTSTRVLGGDLLQLQQMGVSTSSIFAIMAQQTGKTVPQLQKMQQAGKLPADWFITAFQAFSKANFGGMLEAQAKTFTGIWQNVKENLGNAFGDMFAPLFQALKNVGQAILNFEATATFARWVAQAQGWIGTITTVLGAFATTWRNIKESTNLGVLQSGLVALELTLRSTFGPEVAGWFHNALTFFQVDLPAAWKTLQGIWDTLKPKLDELVTWLQDTLPGAVAQFQGMWDALTTKLTPVVPLLGATASALATIATQLIALAGTDFGNTLLFLSTLAAVLALPGFVAGAVALTAIAATAAPLLLLGLALAIIAVMIKKDWPGLLGALESFFSTLNGGATTALQKIALLITALELLNPAKLAEVLLTPGGVTGFLTQETSRIMSTPILGANMGTNSPPLGPAPIDTNAVLAAAGLPSPAAAGGPAAVDNSDHSVTFNNPIVRTQDDFNALADLVIAGQAQAGQKAAASVAPADLVGAS